MPSKLPAGHLRQLMKCIICGVDSSDGVVEWVDFGGVFVKMGGVVLLGFAVCYGESQAIVF